MTEAFDAPPETEAPKAAIRPAATLALIRFTKRGPELLMGRRREDLAFMPGRWVFPGGRVDRADAKIEPLGRLRTAVETRLAQACPTYGAGAAAAAAVRETFEETGVLIGRADPWPAPKGAAWAAFEAAGAGPDFAPFTALARAVTPPGRARRFDARFFLAAAETACLSGPACEPRPADDIAAAEWIPVADVRARPLARITGFVLDEIETRLDLEDPFADTPIPSLEEVDGETILKRL